MKETPIVHECRQALACQSGVLVWRNSTGVDKVKGVRYGLGNGGADLIAFVTMPSTGIARAAGFECKRSEGGRQSADQVSWMTAVRAIGGFYCIVRSREETLAALARCRLGEDR